jgi:hypothetical protein
MNQIEWESGEQHDWGDKYGRVQRLWLPGCHCPMELFATPPSHLPLPNLEGAHPRYALHFV